MKIQSFTLSLLLMVGASAAPASEPTAAAPSLGANFVYKDWEILKETARLALNGRRDGEVLEWINPESGSRGTVVALDTVERDGGTCRSLKFEHQAGGKPEQEVLRFCRPLHGAWHSETPGIIATEPGTRGASVMFGDQPGGAGPLSVPGLAADDECARLSRSIDELKGNPQQRFAAVQRYEAECLRPAK